jgi:acyl-coenzyme A thioesterase PaaI-like protein
VTDDNPRPKGLMRDFPFLERTGIRVLERSPGRVLLEVPVEGNGNHVGTLYAGAMFTVAEASGGVLFHATFDVTRFNLLIGQMTTRFTAIARTDCTAEAIMEPAEITRVAEELDANDRAKFTLPVVIRDAGGTTVCEVSGIYFARSLDQLKF